MKKQDKKDLWDAIKDVLVWGLMTVGSVGALFGAIELIPYALLGIVLKIMMMDKNND